MDESIINELLKDHPLKELPQEELKSLELALDELKSEIDPLKITELRRKFLLKISENSSNNFNTGGIWERYENIFS